MKNITLALAILPFFASCSSDNAAPNLPASPAETAKLANQVDFNNHSFVLEYNPDHTLQHATAENGHYDLSYNNGNISNVSGEMNDEAFDVDFTYAANIISGVTINGVSKVVTYNAALKYYEIADNGSQAKMKYLVNDEGDLIEIQSFGSQGNFIDGKTYYYDAGQKGPLYNANRVTLQLAIACKKQALYSCSFAGYRPFKHFAGAHAAPMLMDNTFDTEGYVLGSVENEENFASFTYTNL